MYHPIPLFLFPLTTVRIHLMSQKIRTLHDCASRLTGSDVTIFSLSLTQLLEQHIFVISFKSKQYRSRRRQPYQSRKVNLIRIELTDTCLTMWPQIVLCFLLTFILDGVCFSFHQHSSTLSTPDRRESRKRRDSSSSLKDHTNGSSYSEQSLSNEEISRYSRHLVLSVSLSTFIVFSVVITELLGWKQETFSPSYLIVTEKDVGMAGQKVLKNASVLVVGAGGLGSPCLL
jgi:hypothetical protein